MKRHRSGSAIALSKSEWLTREYKPRVFPEVTHGHPALCNVAVGTADRDGTLYATDGASIQALSRLDATEVVARRDALNEFWNDALWSAVDTAGPGRQRSIVHPTQDEHCWVCIVWNRQTPDLLRFVVTQSQGSCCVELDPLWVNLLERLNPRVGEDMR